MPCDVILTCTGAQQNMHKAKHEKEGAGGQLKVEYTQRQHPPKIPTLYTHSPPIRADKGQRGACK